jgi:hypothetical protein
VDDGPTDFHNVIDLEFVANVLTEETLLGFGVLVHVDCVVVLGNELLRLKQLWSYQSVDVGAVFETDDGSRGLDGCYVVVPEIRVFGFLLVETDEDRVDDGLDFYRELFDDHLQEIQDCLFDLLFGNVLLLHRSLGTFCKNKSFKILMALFIMTLMNSLRMYCSFQMYFSA